MIVSLPLQKAGRRKIRQICEHLAKRLSKAGFRTDNPFDDIKLPKDRITEARIKFYDLSEYSRLVAAATGQLFDVLRVGRQYRTATGRASMAPMGRSRPRGAAHDGMPDE